MPKSARLRADTRPRRGAAPEGESRAARDRDAWQKGADRDALGASRVGTRTQKRIAEMRARKRGERSLLGSVRQAALRRLGYGFRALRSAAETGAALAHGVREAFRPREREDEPYDTGPMSGEEPDDTDLRTMAAEVASEATKREYEPLPIGGTGDFDVEDAIDAGLTAKGAAKKFTPHPSGTRGVRRSTRRRATKNAGSRRKR